MTKSARFTECQPISHIMDGDNNTVVLRELKLRYPEGLFYLTVGTPKYVADLMANNRDIPFNLRDNEKVFPFDNLKDVKEVCSRLAQVDYADLNPFLEPIDEKGRNINSTDPPWQKMGFE